MNLKRFSWRKGLWNGYSTAEPTILFSPSQFQTPLSRICRIGRYQRMMSFEVSFLQRMGLSHPFAQHMSRNSIGKISKIQKIQNRNHLCTFQTSNNYRPRNRTRPFLKVRRIPFLTIQVAIAAIIHTTPSFGCGLRWERLMWTSESACSVQLSALPLPHFALNAEARRRIPNSKYGRLMRAQHVCTPPPPPPHMHHSFHLLESRCGQLMVRQF